MVIRNPPGDRVSLRTVPPIRAGLGLMIRATGPLPLVKRRVYIAQKRPLMHRPPISATMKAGNRCRAFYLPCLLRPQSLPLVTT